MASTRTNICEGQMILEGTVTNVTNFGAFVDIGVHQDGLVHISALANKFVKDPREVVKAGDIVRTKVMEIDIDRKRIALTMRLDDEIQHKDNSNRSRRPTSNRSGKQPREQRSQKSASAPLNGAFAQALAKAQDKAGGKR